MTEPTGEPLRHERIWTCKIGAQQGQLKDEHLRSAVIQAYQELTGMEPDFIFSGWDGVLTEPERAVVEDRLPEPSTGEPLLDRLDAVLAEWHEAEEDKDMEGLQRVYDELFDAYPELKCLVLQEREERDRTAERLALYQQEVGTLRQVIGRLELERDALVEALKALLEEIDSVNADELGGGPVSPSLVHDARAVLPEEETTDD